jgi:hypothetical protein
MDIVTRSSVERAVISIRIDTYLRCGLMKRLWGLRATISLSQPLSKAWPCFKSVHSIPISFLEEMAILKMTVRRGSTRLGRYHAYLAFLPCITFFVSLHPTPEMIRADGRAVFTERTTDRPGMAGWCHLRCPRRLFGIPHKGVVLAEHRLGMPRVRWSWRWRG